MPRFEILPNHRPERRLFSESRLLCARRQTLRAVIGTSAPDPQETLALPKEVEHWSLTTPREKLVKIGAKVVRHGRYVTFQLAEVAVPRNLFGEILRRIDELR